MMRRCILFLSLVALSLALCKLVMATDSVLLTGMRIQPSDKMTRIIFVLNKQTSGTVKYFPEQKRLLVEFTNTYKNFNLQNARLGGSNVESISTKELSPGHLQFIFNLKTKIRWSIDFLPNQEDKVYLQLQIISLPVVASPIKPSSIQELKNIFAASVENAIDELEQSRALNTNNFAKKPYVFMVVVDAGHGGHDTGALGKNGTREKNVVLNIAKKLAQEINKTPNMRAVLTRSGDYFVPLRDRLKFARKDKADLFIAIHADAYFDASASGVSVYALSERGATSEAARWLAQQENYSEIGNLEFNSLQDRSPMLRKVLIDLAQTATIRDSLLLGTKVLDTLDDVSNMHYRHVEQAPFVVLKSPDIPSILVETGFMTNPREEKRLADPQYQGLIAHALWRGINKYVQKYGALRVGTQDNLSAIAFPFIVRHQLLAEESYEHEDPKINAFIG